MAASMTRLDEITGIFVGVLSDGVQDYMKESGEEIAREAVDNWLEENIHEKISDAVDRHNFTEDIESIIEEFNFGPAIQSELEDYDFSDNIEEALKQYPVRDDLRRAVNDYFESAEGDIAHQTDIDKLQNRVRDLESLVNRYESALQSFGATANHLYQMKIDEMNRDLTLWGRIRYLVMGY